MYKTVIINNQVHGIPRNTPDHIIAAIPDLTCSGVDTVTVIDPGDGTPGSNPTTTVLPRMPIRDPSPKVDAKTYQYVKDLMSANSTQEVEDNLDEIAADRVQNAVDLVLLDVIHDHVDQVLEATVQKATLSVLAEYLKDDEVD